MYKRQEYKKNPEMEMPTVEVNGQECVGMIEIPALGLKLPIISEWSDAKLKKAPCRYSGSAYLKNMIIAGHNYRTHFSGIKRLKMCIRDRSSEITAYNTIGTDGGITTPMVPAAAIRAAAESSRYPRFFNSGTVSYTHLDVYKRQASIPVEAVSPFGMEDIISGSTIAMIGMSCGSTHTNLRFLSISVIT